LPVGHGGRRVNYIFDLETFINCFLFIGSFENRDQIEIFEISDRRNDRDGLRSWLDYLKNAGATMVGFNNLPFDYPILHELILQPFKFSAASAHAHSQSLIQQQNFNRNLSIVRLRDRFLPQVDLMKINHFDNKAKATSLKSLQFAMRSPSVEDLPYDPNVDLSFEQMDGLRSYGSHDVLETKKFLGKCKPMIQMRKDLINNGILHGDVLNFSDVRIGTEYLISKIGRQRCYLGPGKPRQTQRTRVDFKDIILPSIEYRTQPFQAVLDWFRGQTIWMGREDRPKLEAVLGGLHFDFGVGGVHASVESKSFRTDEHVVIRDVDVGGMYPSIAVANGFAPEHLGDSFVTAYRQLQLDRKQYAKGSMMNLVMKLANNGVFGNSNNDFSPFLDPKFTFSITINGQLQLLQLAEHLSLIPGVQLIQANTDGITAAVPRSVEPFFEFWCAEWEKVTKLNLEHQAFDRMFIRDVNNYIAIDTKGKVKRKGAYWYPITDEDYHGSSGSNWNKDFSNLTAQKGVEFAMLNGFRPGEIVRLFSDPFDFMCRYKARGGDRIFIGDQQQLKTTRYYISTRGKPMRKIAPPKGIVGHYKRKNGLSDTFYLETLRTVPAGTWDERIHTKNKSRYAEVTTSIESGRLVKECNRSSDFDWSDVDWDYYTKEIEKLMIGGSHVAI
jgi:hypothetical protein